MRSILLLSSAVFFLTACGQTTGESAQEEPAEALRNAANQSDAAAAQVLNDRANQMEASGTDNYAAAQDALQQGGQAQVASAQGAASGPPSGSVQARPNLPASSNRKGGTAPPDKMISNGQQTGVAGSQNLPQDR